MTKHITDNFIFLLIILQYLLWMFENNFIIQRIYMYVLALFKPMTFALWQLKYL